MSERPVVTPRRPITRVVCTIAVAMLVMAACDLRMARAGTTCSKVGDFAQDGTYVLKCSPRHRWVRGITTAAGDAAVAYVKSLATTSTVAEPTTTAIATTSTTITATTSTSTTTTTAPPPPSDVPTFLNGVAHTGYNGAETIVNASSAPALTRRWTAAASNGAYISTQPIVADGVVYWGDSNGNEYATNATTGAHIWTRNVGSSGLLDANPDICGPTSEGVGGASTVATVGGHHLLFVGGGGNVNGPDGNGVYYYALDADTGTIFWQTKIGLGPTPAAHSDPNPYDMVWAGSVLSSTSGTPSLYVAVAAHGDCSHYAHGRVLKLNAASGAVDQTTFLGVGACLGSDVWGTPTIDEAAHKVYISTSEAEPSCAATTAQPYADSLVELDASSLAIVDSWQLSLLTDPYSADHDFGTTPILFHDGSRSLVGAVNKNGKFYAFVRDHLSDGPVWSHHVSDPGDAGPDNGSGSISPAAFDGTNLYVSGGYQDWTNQTCAPVESLDPATGVAHWTRCVAGPVLGAVSAAPGIVAVGAGSHLEVLASSNGAVLKDVSWDAAAAWIFATPTIANGWIYVAGSAGNLYGVSP